MDRQLLEKEIRFRASRRGLKETDLLFARFLKDGLEGLSDDDLLALREVLHHTDQDLLLWVIEGHLPPEQDTPLMRRLQACARELHKP
ncbi:MAG: succinate dehydrogenase assembly factor 2 [Proteobacteria bacterium]|nr:succinate dehydrogenase assembly factor 2 [Pseudomonadota bacterium]